MLRRCVLIIALLFLTAGCRGGLGLEPNPGMTDVASDATTRVISGDEALSMYGIDPNRPEQTGTPTVTAEAWFPTDAWVSASVLPYDDPEPIRYLPAYSEPSLDVGGTWLGDLPEASRVRLVAVDQSGRACFVVGDAVQGWEVEGWVACNRLLFERPTVVPGE